LARVLYFESYSHDISAVLENETHIFIDSLSKLEKDLQDKGFVRISQSFLVNMRHVFNVSGNQVTIKKGKDLPIGRSYKQALVDAVNKMEADKWNI
jgi:DNA-binding LytR/AlgR family response regulator